MTLCSAISKYKTKSINWRVEDQLRAALLTDLNLVVPDNYFNSEKNRLRIDESLDRTGQLSKELSWGTAAGELGRTIYFSRQTDLTPRQLSAAYVLMNLGLFTGARASQEACSNVKDLAASLKVFDGNSGAVSHKLMEEQIPQLNLNFRGGLVQYIRHLAKEEASPYLPLLEEEDLAELGLRVRMRDRAISAVVEHLGSIIVSAASAVTAAILLLWFGAS